MRSENLLPPLDLIFLMTARALSLKEPIQLADNGQILDPRALSLRPQIDYDLERTFTLFDLMATAHLVMSRNWLQRWPLVPRVSIEVSIRSLVTEGRFTTFDGQPWRGVDHELLKLVHHVPADDDGPIAA